MKYYFNVIILILFNIILLLVFIKISYIFKLAVRLYLMYYITCRLRITMDYEIVISYNNNYNRVFARYKRRTSIVILAQ